MQANDSKTHANQPSPTQPLRHELVKEHLTTTLLSKHPPSVVLQTLSTISTLVTNILEHPDEPKYRSVRFSNRLVRATVCEVDGARKFLQRCGFYERVLEFEERFVFEGEVDT